VFLFSFLFFKNHLDNASSLFCLLWPTYYAVSKSARLVKMFRNMREHDDVSDSEMHPNKPLNRKETSDYLSV
jgi:hypothetical protein